MLGEMKDTAIDEQLKLLRMDILADNKVAAIKRLGEITEALAHKRQRYADQMLVRAGYILRAGLTAEQYYEAEAKARREHPEAWAQVLPTKEVAEAEAAKLAAQNVEGEKKK